MNQKPTAIQNRKQFETEIVNTLSFAPTVVPRCNHFYECGGCQLQDYAYANQADAKLTALKKLFGQHLTESQLNAYKIVTSPQEYEYRMKMEYVFSLEEFGLRKSRRFQEVVNLTECHLIPTELFIQLLKFRKTAIDLQIPTFNLKNEEGFLRYFVIKQVSTNQKMLNIVTGSKDHAEKIAKLAEAILAAGFTSVNWLFVPPAEDHTFGEILQTWGSTNLVAEVGGYKFQIGAHTFFQNNIPAFEHILNFIGEYVPANSKVLDLYSGVGTIGLQFANKVEKLVGVDEIVESIELAGANAKLNGIENAKYFAMKVSEFLKHDDYVEYKYRKQSDLDTKYETNNEHYDLFILDPARPGLEGKVCRRIQKYFSPERLIYISCNPVTQLQDLERLLVTYKIVDIRGFDLFPQTYHVENVIVLDRK